jgi:integrase
VTFALDGYETSLRERQLEHPTIVRARAHLDALFAVEKNGHKLLAWLTPKRAAALYNAYRTQPRKATKRVPSVDTHRNALAAGRAFGRFAAEKGWLPADPFEKVKAIGRRKKGKPQLGVDETRKLLDVCIAEGSRESLAVACTFLLGAGASEVTNRLVRDLDDNARLLHVTKGKNGYRVRSFEVPDEIRSKLAELAKGRAGAAYLFGETDLERPSRYWIHYHCRRLCGVAKVPLVSPHGLRGTHATIAHGHVSSSQHVVAALAAAASGLGHAPGSPITASTYIAPGAVDKAKQRAALRVLRGDSGNSNENGVTGAVSGSAK